MTTVYQTATREQRQRFRYWSSLMCRTFAPAHGSVDDTDDFDARFTVSELGATTICTVSAPKQFWERTAQHVRRSPRDEFLFTQLLAGRGVLRQNGKELVLRPGTMAVYDVNRPYTYEVDGDVLFVKLPRRNLIERINTEPLACATAIRADAGVAAWASGVVQQAATLDSMPSGRTAELVGDSVICALAGLLSRAPDGGTQTSTDAPSLLSRICTHIQTQIGDPHLSLASIARAQGVSERSLHRLFASLGTTPMRWLLQQRLALSHRALREDHRARITDVAFTHGFNDLSHFSRVFKKRYAVTPQQLAAAARCGLNEASH